MVIAGRSRSVTLSRDQARPRRHRMQTEKKRRKKNNSSESEQQQRQERNFWTNQQIINNKQKEEPEAAEGFGEMAEKNAIDCKQQRHPSRSKQKYKCKKSKKINGRQNGLIIAGGKEKGRREGGRARDREQQLLLLWMPVKQ